MSANAEVLQGCDPAGAAAPQTEVARSGILRESDDWSPQTFAREQIRSLVRRVFLENVVRPSKQVAFSATEVETDVADLCDQAGWALALETKADVAIVGREPSLRDRMWPVQLNKRIGSIKSWSTRTAINLWRVPGSVRGEWSEPLATARSWLSFLAALRNEFEYAVIHAPVAGASSEAALLGQLGDGIVLVLGAHRTRRATACQIKETLESAHCRILGTVLSDRTFPVPGLIYRHL